MRNQLAIIICFLVGFPSLLFAQNSNTIELDSTQTAHLIDSLNKAAFNRKNTNLSEALSMLVQIKDLAQKINYHKGLSSAYYTEAGIYQQNGFNKRAHLLYEIALDNSIKYNDTVNIPMINIQIAASKSSEGQIDEAVKLYNQSLEAFVKQGMIKDVANTKNSLGLIEIKRNNYTKAEALFKEALQLSLSLKFVYGQKKSFYNLGLLAIAKKIQLRLALISKILYRSTCC